MGCMCACGGAVAEVSGFGASGFGVPGQEAAQCDSARPNRRTSRVAFRGEAPVEGDPLLGFAAYEHKRPRRNSITPDRQRAFIAALAATGIVTQAARSIGASLEALYKLRNMPGAEGFAAAWEAAVDRGMQRLEDCALERAIAGEERPIVRRGEVVGMWRRYDTQLLMFLLRNRRRERFDVYGGHWGERPPSAEEERAKAMEAERESEAIIASINAKLEKMRERSLAAKAEEERLRQEALAEAEAVGEAERASADAPCPADDAAEEVPEGGPRLRDLPNLLKEGDAALGFPHLSLHGRMRQQLGLANMPRDPLPVEVEDYERWQADLDAGRIGPKSRGEV